MGRRNTRKLRNAKQLTIRYALFTEGLVTERRRCQWVVAMSSLNASVGVR